MFITALRQPALRIVDLDSGDSLATLPAAGRLHVLRLDAARFTENRWGATFCEQPLAELQLVGHSIAELLTILREHGAAGLQARGTAAELPW